MEHKTDWKLKDTVTPGDMNRIEGNIKELETPSFNDSGTVSDINSFTDFVNSVKSKMSIFDFFRNFKAGLKYIVHQGQIINSQDVTQAGFAMDARQANPNIPGSLGAKISDLNKNINGVEIMKHLPFNNMGALNAFNIDEQAGNWISGFANENMEGTFPHTGWQNVIQFDTSHFRSQLSFDTNPLNSKDLYLRNKWANDTDWQSWNKIITNSDFTYENILVDTIANQSVEIIGAPTAPNYIPTITSVGSTLTYYSSFTYLDNAKKWYIYSNVSQQVRVIFYKLPSSK